MKVSTKIDKKLLPNENEFPEPFFQRPLAPMGRPLQLTKAVSKTYDFPTFYSNVRCAIAIFFCNADAAARMMPHPRMKPVSMGAGRSLVIFSGYHYRKVRNLAPYCEIAMSIPMQLDGIHVPILPVALPGLFSGFGYSVFSMPVTSLENQIRVQKIWGLPKVVQEIDLRVERGNCTTIAWDEKGKEYFRFRVPTDGPTKRFDVSSHLYTMLDGRLLKSPTAFQGDFATQKHPGTLFAKNKPVAEPFLVVGSSAAAKPLRDLQIEPHAFETRYTDDMKSCFDLPNPV